MTNTQPAPERVIFDKSQEGFVRKVVLEWQGSRCNLSIQYGPADKVRIKNFNRYDLSDVIDLADEDFISGAKFLKERLDEILAAMPPDSRIPSEHLVRLRQEEVRLAAQEDLEGHEGMIQMWIEARSKLLDCKPPKKEPSAPTAGTT